MWGACFQDGISYRVMCFTGRHVVLEDSEDMSHRREYLACLASLDVLQEYIFYRKTSYRMIYLTRGHFLHKDRSYWMACLTSGHVLQDTCTMNGHVLLKYMI